MKQFMLLALTFTLLTIVTASAAFAAPTLSLTVNSIADTDDGACDILGTGSGNQDCTLREAINASNASVGVTDTIAFGIPGGGVKTIRPTTALPTITDTVVIDGYTQSGASPNTLAQGDNAALKIELDGHLAPASTNGLRLDADNSVVRGLVINRFSDSAFLVYGDFNVIEGNFLGTNATGTAARANGEGMNLCSGSIKNLIGGTTLAARNLISGNTYDGIDMSRCSTPSSGNTIQGNYIGTNRNGNVALANSIGISLSGDAHVVGGLNAAARNVISGNGVGIQIYNANDNVVSANYIGTQTDGKHALPNGTGIYVRGSLIDGFSNRNRVGGTTKPEANRIAFNTGNGILIGTSPTDGDAKNTIERNSIFSNGGLAIDLGNNGVTSNDANDADTGPNLLQNYPVLRLATSATRKIRGKLLSTPNTTFTLEFFKNPACDTSQYGEGKTFLGRTTVMTDALGAIHFSFLSTKRFAAGNAITATATDDVGNTSEFSKCKTAQ